MFVGCSGILSYTYFSTCRISALILASVVKDGRQNWLTVLNWNVHQVISYTSDIRLTKNLCCIWSAELVLRFGLAHGLTWQYQHSTVLC
jgi:hypothetical protein